jgi:hypothetical protein
VEFILITERINSPGFPERSLILGQPFTLVKQLYLSVKVEITPPKNRQQRETERERERGVNFTCFER